LKSLGEELWHFLKRIFGHRLERLYDSEMIVTNDNNKTVLAKCFEDAIPLQWRGALTEVHVDISASTCEALNIWERTAQKFCPFDFWDPQRGPWPLSSKGPLPKRNSTRIEIGFEH